jgi:hypothetical protein
MTPEEFVACLRREVLEQNLQTYDAVLSQDRTAPVKDEYWRAVLDLYAQLGDSQQRVLKGIFRQVIVDTISNMLGVLDGTTILESHRKDFLLTYGGESRKLNGYLQDLFLSDQ